MTSPAQGSKRVQSAPGSRAEGTWSPSKPSGSSEPAQGGITPGNRNTQIVLSDPKSVHVRTHPDEG